MNQSPLDRTSRAQHQTPCGQPCVAARESLPGLSGERHLKGPAAGRGETGVGQLFRVALLLVVMLATGGCGAWFVPAGGGRMRESDAENDVWWQQMPALASVELAQGERLQVVATTSIVADVVHQVGGNRIELTTLVRLGTDPHAFEPTPRDAAALADADVVFVNGAGLEAFLDDLLQSTGGDVPVVPVSYGLELHQLQDIAHVHDDPSSEDLAPADGESDPHVWFDPNNVTAWTRNIELALSALDPERSGMYSADAEAYRVQLEALDAWIERQVAQVPEGDRKLVTDHAVLSYFAERYGFEQAGAVLPGFSTLSEPSARALAALQTAIQAWDVKAIFVGQTTNPDLAERVADDMGVPLVALYTGSLSGPDGPAGDYLSFMRYDVTAIVQALR